VHYKPEAKKEAKDYSGIPYKDHFRKFTQDCSAPEDLQLSIAAFKPAVFAGIICQTYGIYLE